MVRVAGYDPKHAPRDPLLARKVGGFVAMNAATSTIRIGGMANAKVAIRSGARVQSQTTFAPAVGCPQIGIVSRGVVYE
jgi:hypothetical protein